MLGIWKKSRCSVRDISCADEDYVYKRLSIKRRFVKNDSTRRDGDAVTRNVECTGKEINFRLIIMERQLPPFVSFVRMYRSKKIVNSPRGVNAGATPYETYKCQTGAYVKMRLKYVHHAREC